VNPPGQSSAAGLTSFRAKLMVAMMIVVSAAVAAGLVFAQRKVSANARRDFQQIFLGELDTDHAVQQVRDAVVADRCRALARRPRIHAALEDGALDLLYPSARDELLDVMSRSDPLREPGGFVLHARFYRFLDPNGRVIPPPNSEDVGSLRPEEEARLSLPALPEAPETGYLLIGKGTPDEAVDEVIAMPIVSTETGAVISAVVLGFGAREAGPGEAGGMLSGVWLDGGLHLSGLAEPAWNDVAKAASRAIAAGGNEVGLEVSAGKNAYLLFCKRLNPGSVFAPAYEVAIYPLAASLARQRALFWEFMAAGAVVFVGALAASHFLAGGLSKPVERLAVDSEENRAQRYRAEAALEATSRDLERSARFSANASHQLKTPVTVLRTGLEELLAGEYLSSAAREEVSALVHQTFRLAGVIEDLLLLSRMDAGRLQIQFSPIDLTPLIAAWIDDLGTLADGFGLAVDSDYPPTLWIEGEMRFATLILQNLLENARKYNRVAGSVRIAARIEGGWACLLIGNTGRAIPPASHEHIFERFHRGAVGENVPGHGIGLNLARELARLHGGDLRLVRSQDDWTEFEVRFRRTTRPADASALR
jgi:signal transduction histidine kinase